MIRLLCSASVLLLFPASAAGEIDAIWLTCEPQPQTLTAELKTLTGQVLDRQEFSAAQPAAQPD